MSLEIYYFTGTGNSLAVAREIAANTGGALISISSVEAQSSIRPDANSIAIVFPTYLAHLYGIPLVVERFVRKINDIGSRRLFAVCTCGGYESVNALPTLRHLNRLIRSLGGRLFGQYSVRLPMNNLDYDHIPVPIETRNDVILMRSKPRILEISRRIIDGKRSPYRTPKFLFNSFMTPMYRMMRNACITPLREHAKEPNDSALTFRELFPMTDNDIVVNDDCNGCGTCAKICPARNIDMVDDRPVWKHQCEACFACDEWCPKDAIHHWGRSKGIRYHHPDVTVADMIRQAADTDLQAFQ